MNAAVQGCARPAGGRGTSVRRVAACILAAMLAGTSARPAIAGRALAGNPAAPNIANSVANSAVISTAISTANSVAYAAAPSAAGSAADAAAQSTNASAAISVVDDTGGTVQLAGPAQRIVALSPGITELLFSIGAGDRIVGVSEYADYPPQATTLPRVARAQGIDLERIAALRADLIVTWGSGFSPALLDALRRIGVPVYVLEARSLETIATSLERLGRLTGSTTAPRQAQAFRERLARLRARYADASSVRIFYQVWNRPIMTLTGAHLVSEVMRTCGARNVFEDLQPLVATVDEEAVIAAQPQILLTAESGGADRGALAGWRRFAQIPAVANGHLITLDADALDRGSTRVLDATQALCAAVEQVRRDMATPAR